MRLIPSRIKLMLVAAKKAPRIGSKAPGMIVPANIAHCLAQVMQCARVPLPLSVGA